MDQTHLLFRERQGLATIITLTLQCVLDRTTGDFDPEPVLREIEDVVQDTLAAIRGRASATRPNTSLIHTPIRTPTVAVEAPVKVLSPSPKLVDSGVLKSALERLSNELLRGVMHYLPRAQDLCSGYFTDLISASHVCRRWRSVAVSSQSLWAVIRSPSVGEMSAMGLILSRTGSMPLHLDINLSKAPIGTQQKLFSAFASHMYHIKVLILRHDSDYEQDHERPLLASRAPVLRELRLYSNKRFQLRSDFLGGRAPALTTFACCLLSLLPPSCPALASVTTLHLVHNPQPISIDDARYIFHFCPHLAKVRLDFCLRGAQTTLAVRTVDGFKGLRELNITELAEDGQHTNMVTTLRMFDYKEITRVHLRSGTAATIFFVMKELKNIKHLFFLRSPAQNDSMLVLREDKRQFSSSLLVEADLESVLKRAWLASWQLTSLSIWEYVAARDSTTIAQLDLKSLDIFTVFVRGRSLRTRLAGSSLSHVFDLFQHTKKEWNLPALATLAFDARVPVEDFFPDLAAPPALSASAILRFFQSMMQRGVLRSPRLVLDGVVFRERFAGPEVAALWTTFSDVLLYT